MSENKITLILKPILWYIDDSEDYEILKSRGALFRPCLNKGYWMINATDSYTVTTTYEFIKPIENGNCKYALCSLVKSTTEGLQTTVCF